MARAHLPLRYAAATLFTVVSGAALAQAPVQPMPSAATPNAAAQQQGLETTYLMSRLSGSDVYSLTGAQKIADLEDVVVSERGQIVAVILSHGGSTAGVGKRHVAVNPGYFRLRPISINEVRVETSLTAEQLQSVPQFEYPARRR